MLREPQKLSYFLSEKNNILVITFGGALTKFNLAKLEECLSEVQKHDFRFLVLNFQDVSQMDMFALPEIARFQKLMRAKPAVLRMCFLKPDQKALLNDRGLVRPGELSENLFDAIRSLASATTAPQSPTVRSKAA